MHYKVTAHLKEEKAKEFLSRLQDGSIACLKPDGQEIVDSMKRAVVLESGLIQWSEVCYCDTPLKHERETVLDLYFSELETEQIAEIQNYEGDSFMEYLVSVSK